MAYERAVKRMDQAVASSWLRGLRSQRQAGDGQPDPRLLAKATRVAKLDRKVAAAER